jgi:hypothetical protein
MRGTVLVAVITPRSADWRTFLFDRGPKPARYSQVGKLARHVRIVNMLQLVIRDPFPPSQWRSARTIVSGDSNRRCLRRHRFPRGLSWALALSSLCVGLMLMGSVSLAANDGSGVPRDRSAVQPDARIAALLRKVEQQVSAGHAMSPAEDSAMDTWQQVLELRRADPASPPVLAAITNFASYMKVRATEERTAGRLVVSSDLAVFADQANRLLAPPIVAAPLLPADNSRAAPPWLGPEAQTSRAAVAAGTGIGRRDALSVDKSPADKSAVDKSAVDKSAVDKSAGDKSPGDKFGGPGGFPPPQPAMPFLHETAAASAPGKGTTPRSSAAAGPVLAETATNLRQAAAAGATAVRPTSGSPSISREAAVLPVDKMPIADPVLVNPPAVGLLAANASSKGPLAEVPPAEAGKAAAPPATASVALATQAQVRPPETAPPPAASEPRPDPVTILLRRGDVLLQQNDVVAARLFYERAAAAGSGEGATSMGKTYDPNFLATIDAHSLKGDVAQAIEWYRKASTVLGDKEAGVRLKVLTAQTVQ